MSDDTKSSEDSKLASNKIDTYFKTFDTAKIIQSYRDHMCPELKAHRMWLPCIGRLPPCKYKGEHSRNLMLFDEALDKLADHDWLTNRLLYFAKKNPNIWNKPPHLMAWLIDTVFCYADFDFRKIWLPDGSDYKRDDDKKPIKKNMLDTDQTGMVNLMTQELFVYRSMSGNGFHGWMRKTAETTIITDRHVNLQQPLSPFELKYHACFFPAIMDVISPKPEIIEAPAFVERICYDVAQYKDKPKAKVDNRTLPLDTVGKIKDRAADNVTDNQKQETTGDQPPPAPRPAPAVEDSPKFEKHSGLDKLLDQYRYLAKKGISFIPTDHDGYGGWHKRLTTMGCPKIKIREIASHKSQKGYVPGKDDKDIEDSTPYDDVEKQAGIEFGRIKQVFAKHNLSLDNVRKTDNAQTTNANKQTTNAEEPVRPVLVAVGEVEPSEDVPQIHPFMTAPGLHWLIASDPGSGKSTMVWHWMSELTKQGYAVIHIHADQKQGKVAARMKEMHCDPRLALMVDLDIYTESGLPFTMSRELLRDEIRKALKARGLTKVGCICIDPGNKIVEKLWDAIAPKNYRGSLIAFNEKERDHAQRASGMIFRWLAQQFNTTVGVIGHPPKNSDGRNRYPGNVAWEGEAEIVFRMWKLTRTTIDAMPKSILKLFQRMPEHQNFRVLSCIKSRAEQLEAGEFNTMLLRNEDGSVNTVTIDKVDDKIDLLPEADDKYPPQHEYLAAARDHLIKHPHAKLSVRDINKAINYRTADYPYCVGVLTIEAMKRGTGFSLTSGKRGGALFIASAS